MGHVTVEAESWHSADIGEYRVDHLRCLRLVDSVKDLPELGTKGPDLTEINLSGSPTGFAPVTVAARDKVCDVLWGGQLLVAGVTVLIMGPVMGERIVGTPGATAWLALAYLIVMGSIVAYTDFVYLLGAVRPALAASYAYVNPIVAVVLGLTLGAEIITGPIFIALPLILAGVCLIAAVGHNPKSATSLSIPSPTEPLEEPA